MWPKVTKSSPVDIEDTYSGSFDNHSQLERDPRIQSQHEPKVFESKL